MNFCSPSNPCSMCQTNEAARNAQMADATLDAVEYAKEWLDDKRERFSDVTKTTPTYRTLSEAFLQLMDEIGSYGEEKYGEQSIAAKFRRGDFSRSDRTKAREIGNHVNNHFQEYLDGVLHDKFGTRKHQLAAAAFNAMMEFQLAGLEKE